MGGELTVSEKIIYHLNGYVKFEDKYEAPFDVTQDGISQACSVSRAHAAIELKKLKASGMIDEKLSHVRRGKTRRKVYVLTFAGKAKASEIVQYVRENTIDTGVDASRVSPEGVSSRTRALRRSSPMPAVRDFFGREKEIADVMEFLEHPTAKVLSVKGISGIGKTTLVAKAVSQSTGHRVFWYAVHPWDSVASITDAMGKFFSENGSRKLSVYLSSGRLELSELSFLLGEELAENGFAFVFDEADACDAIQEFLRMFRHSSGSAKMITTIETEPTFYDRSDVVARREVVEMELVGLDKAAAISLLRSRGIEGKVAEELWGVTGGHPLSLEMVTQTQPEEARQQVSRFFEDKFYSALQEPERSLMQFASVFDKSFPSEAIPRELRHARKGSMLREVAPGRFEIHNSLKGFVYKAMTRDERARWHSVAADHYLRSEEYQERLIHLIHAGRSLEAEILLARSGERFLVEGNVQRLWEALRVFDLQNRKYIVSGLLTKARVASLVGAYDDAWLMLEKASAEGDPYQAAEASIEMGRIESKRGRFAEAVRHFQKSLDCARDSPGVRAKAMRGLGVIEGKMGNFERAQALLEDSAKEAMAAMDSKGMLLAHMELGNVFIGRGKHEEAIDHFSKCAAGFGPVEMANVYINLGIAHASLGRLDESRRHLENAVRLADETGQPRTKAYALTALAEVLTKTKEPDGAAEMCFSALEILTGLGDKVGISAAYANLGMAERVAGHLHSSEEHYLDSISALEGIDVPRSLASRKLEFALLLKEMQEVGRAAALLNESRELFVAAGATDMLARVDEELRGLAAQADNASAVQG